MSKAQSAVGEHAKAQASIDKAIQIAPNTAKFRHQRDSLGRNPSP